MGLLLVPDDANPWSQPGWRLSNDYPSELLGALGNPPDSHLAAEQLYALAKSLDISDPGDPRLDSNPFPSTNGMMNAMAASLLRQRLQLAQKGFRKVYLKSGESSASGSGSEEI